MTPNYAASIEFLRRFHPGRRWALTAIHPDKNFKPRTMTATYDAKHEAECVKWLEDKGATYNIYFSVAEPNKHLLKKAERTDIDRVWYLHVDIDPRTGEPIPAEQARILGLLQGTGRTEVIPGKLPKPAIITFSGGGYQGFWPLETPIEIGGSLEKAEDAKLHNLHVELVLGADNCHNIDRVMRLPGTINRPDANKIAKGRVEALAEVIAWDEIKYGLDRFPKANPIGKADPIDDSFPGQSRPKKDNSAKYQAPADVKRLETLDDLPVADWVKALINIGYDAKNPNPMLPKKYPSRSEALFAVVCALVKGGCTKDVIYSILTDSRFGISDSVLELGSRADRYATRQIDRAMEEAVHPWLKKMNERFAVVESIGGRCRVIEEQWDEGMKRFRMAKQTFDDFQNRYMHIKVDTGFNSDGKPTSKPLGLWWLSQPNRRQYDKIVFAPGQDVDGSYNLWRGYGCECIPGDCSLFLEHVKTVICGGREEHYKYLLGWMATTIQHPDRTGGTAIVLKGDQGTGKGVFAKGFGKLLGRHNMQIADPKHLVGNFNAHLRDCVVLFADEAFFAGDKKHENILKMLITEEMLTIEAKGVDAESSANCVHLIMASNDHWVVPAGVGDRRFFVLHVNSTHKEDTAYFESIMSQLKDGGYEALLHYLMHYDISKFDGRLMPKTDELQQQKIFSLGCEEKWLREKLVDGRLLPEQGSWERDIPEGTLYYDYLNFAKTANAYRRMDKSALKAILTKYLPVQQYNADASILVIQTDGQMKMTERPRMYRFPALDECRKLWDINFGGKTEWDSGMTTNEQYAAFKE